MYRFILFFGLNLLLTNVFAQATLPETFFLNYNNNFAVINPANLGFDYTKGVDIRYAGYSGVKNVLKTIYVDAVINPIDSARIRTGLQVYAYNEGDYIRYNNLKWINSYAITNHRDFKLTFGLGIGLINYAFVNNVEEASDWGIDLDAGIWTKYRKLQFGLSTKHNLPVILKPLETQFKANKMGHVIVLYKWHDRPRFEIESGLHWAVQSAMYQNMPISIYNTLTFSQIFQTFCHINGFKLVTVGIGFKQMKIYEIPLGMNIAFNQSISKDIIIPSNRYEIGINVKF